MDDFVKQAFANALAGLAEDEFNAYERRFINGKRGEKMNMVAILRTGVEKIDALLASLDQEQGETLAEYISILIISAFHEGYTARMEDE